MKVIFMGTPDIATTVLQGLLETDVEVVLAVTQPDKKTGRKQTLQPSPVKVLAQAHNIPVFQPDHIKTDFKPVEEAEADLIVTCAYGQIVPKEVLEAPRYGCVNLHGSLLPKWRGGAPIQRAIWNGDATTGMTLMEMVDKMDAGAMYAVKEIPIEDTDDAGTLFEKLGHVAAELIKEEIHNIADVVPVPQKEEEVTFAPIIKKEEERLNLGQDDRTVWNQIRALAPAPGAWIIANGKKLKLLKAALKEGKEAPLHTFFSPAKGKLGFQLQDAWLDLETVQLQGKPVMDVKSFMNGQGRSLVGTLGA